MILKLYFTKNEEGCALNQITFASDHSSKPLISRRGESNLKNGSFKWTPAVKSLSLFFIKASLNLSSKEDNNEPLLSGYQGSSAASLDYALSKQPIWMNEMFGADHAGKSILFKLIRRENTELKRPGPVSIYLSPLAEREVKIEIYLNDLLVNDIDILHELIATLDQFKNSNKPISKKDSNTSLPWRSLENYVNELDNGVPAVGEDTKKFISHLVSKNLEEAFDTLDIFQETKFNNHINKILNTETLLKDGARPQYLINQISKNNNFKNLLGIIADSDYQYLREKLGNITIKTNIWGFSNNVLLAYLKYVKEIPLTIDYSEVHSHAIFRSIESSEKKDKSPEIVILGLGGVLNVSKMNLDYELLLPTPSCSISLVEPKVKSPSKKKDKPILVDIEARTTSGLFALEEAKKNNPLIKLKQAKATDRTYDEVFSMFKEGEDIQTLSHYPHNEIAVKCNDAKTLFRGELHGFFMISKAISEDTRLTHILNAAIRDAWLTIRSQPQLRKLLAKSILVNEHYMKSFGRISGLYQLER